MKTTEHFKITIQTYLEQRAAYDELFAVSYRNPAKNIDDCITYILNTVQKSGCAGFADDEIFSMAMHYYDEDIIDIGKAIDCQVVINRHIELTEQEKEQAKRDAIKRAQDEAYAKYTNRNKPTAPKQSEVQQASLF